MTFETILYSKKEAIAEIRLNRPARMNAVIQTLYDEVLQALAQAEADENIKVVILTGEGRAFCAGADMKEHSAGTRTPYQVRQYLRYEQDVCRKLYNFPKPIIAAVNGYALGAGAELAIAADFILMAESAKIGFPEVSVGAFLGGGVTHILPRLVGLAKAKELIFSGRFIDGREAHTLGLATRVFPDASFSNEVESFAKELITKAPISLALAKSALNQSYGRDFEGSLAVELEGMTFCTTTEDWHEGVKSFAEKRTPVFKGK